MKYHIWTEGCQMNVADSMRISSALEHLGCQVASHPEEADVIVLNTCVVRQSAEDKAYSHLGALRPLKAKRPDLVINLMGCMVGVKGDSNLRKRFPYVDVFSPPSDPGPLIAFLTQGLIRRLEQSEIDQRFAAMDGELILPLPERGKLIASYVPVVIGCSHACTFCIIPYRRGAERSRPVAEIVHEIRTLVEQGVKEITLLGQIVDRYGKDIPDGPDLADLLLVIQDIGGLERIRFLTSHPNFLTDKLLDTVAESPKVMPHIEVPVQAGDDAILAKMKRGYTRDDYYRLVEKIRFRLQGKQPGVSIATDVIVGFPGESEIQFQRTFDLLADLKLDTAHLARYSPRPGTLAERRMEDDIPDDEKWRRFRLLEDLQELIAAAINQEYTGKTVEVLFEDYVRGRWKGRTPTNKLVFVEAETNLRGQLVPVQITWAGSWSMQAILPVNPGSEISLRLLSVAG